MSSTIEIAGREIGQGKAVYIIAELSANHNQDFDQAVKLIEAAKASGADAVKVQTYTADTLTLNCRNPYFQVAEGSLWQGQYLYELYQQAYTPWEWQAKLKKIANDLGLAFFSSPFDDSSVDFLQQMEVPAYKIASFELVDIPLLEKVAKTGKPLIMSTGMASLAEIDEAVETVRAAGAKQIALLKCSSAYPAPAHAMNLQTIPHLAQAFNLPTGLSDHSLELAVPVTAVALGACIIEKHFTLSRDIAGPDSAFSLQPEEFKTMVDAVRVSEQARGKVCYQASEKEQASQAFRRSLFVVETVEKGAVFTSKNVRSIRPAYGLHTRYLPKVLGRFAAESIKSGTPLGWDMVV